MNSLLGYSTTGTGESPGAVPDELADQVAAELVDIRGAGVADVSLNELDGVVALMCDDIRRCLRPQQDGDHTVFVLTTPTFELLELGGDANSNAHWDVQLHA